MPRLSETQRIESLRLLASGVSVADVARQMNCNRRTVINLQQRYNVTGHIKDRPRAGRPKVTTVRQDRYMTLTHRRQRFKTAKSTAIEYGVSPQTVLRRLRIGPAPIRPRRPYVGQILNRLNRHRRMLWARRHRHWRRAQWSRVLFSDESRFNVSFADGRLRVYRRRGERFDDNCVIERDRFGGGGVMVWGGIMGDMKTDLIVVQGNMNADRYIDQVLRPVVVPFLTAHPGILMHDNARPHTAMRTRDFLQRNGVDVLQWPACSPDMNPIEHIWALLGQNARANHQINNVRDLTAALIHEWNAIPNDVIRRYVRSMRSRVLTLHHRRGGHNRY